MQFIVVFSFRHFLKKHFMYYDKPKNKNILKIHSLFKQNSIAF